MQTLSFDQLAARAAEYDDLVARTPEIDRFCSSAAWVLSAYEAFSPGYTTWITDFDGEGFAALVQSEHERLGRFRQPLEASWCLASPIVGADLPTLARRFAQACRHDQRDWDLLFLSGVTRHSPLYHGLVEGFAGAYFVGVGPPVSRYIASLEGGVDGFLSRRAPKFRANLRRLDRRAREQGLGMEWLATPAQTADWQAIYARILEIESRSWKGQQSTGIADAHMHTFYSKMLPRLAATGRLRALFITHEGRDLAFVFGGVWLGMYRGLQLSFDDHYRALSLGNLAQLWIIERLCAEGVSAYDLGSELDYKKGWAEQRHDTISLVIRPW